jgi:hypothetical protein
MPEGLAPASLSTLASGTAPGPAPAADPGPSAVPAPAPKTFNQQRLAQDHAAPQPLPRPSAPENPRSRGYSPARDMREAVAARAAEPVPNEAPRADGQPPAEGEPAAEKFRIGKYEVSEGELGAMMERQSLEDLRKATVPPSPADYKVAIPEGMKLPGDQQFKFDEAGNKAAFDAARAWAHNKGMSQSDFSEMLGLYASQEASQHAALAARSAAEIAKAGVNAPQRVDAVGKWITGMVGEKDAAPIRATMVTDAHLRFYEKIIHLTTTQGGASFSQSHRVPPDTGGIPGFDKMSFAEQRFAQDQIAARRRGGR